MPVTHSLQDRPQRLCHPCERCTKATWLTSRLCLSCRLWRLIADVWGRS